MHLAIFLAAALTSGTDEFVSSSVAFLVESQEDGGKWPYEGRYRVDGEIPVTYDVGGTAIVCLALLYGADAQDEAARGAFDRGLAFVLDQLDHPMMVPSRELTYDMRVLGQAYALLMLCHVRKAEAEGAEAERIAAAIPQLVDALAFEQMKDGGWNYQGRPVQAAFVTASVVQALLWAEAVGEKVSKKVLSRARTALDLSRFKDGGVYYFGTKKTKGKRDKQDLLPGSVGRAPICETMLQRLGAGSTKRVRASLDAFHEHWDELEARRQKSGTHEGPYLIAPYYFYYGHRYAAQAALLLPEAAREKERERIVERILQTRDQDGTWNDREFPRARKYGTAMVVLTLLSEKVGLPPRRR